MTQTLKSVNVNFTASTPWYFYPLATIIVLYYVVTGQQVPEKALKYLASFVKVKTT